jgi:hypothetical protein
MAGVIGFLVALLVASPAEAGESTRVLDVDSLALTYKQFLPGGNDPLVTGPHLLNRTLDKEVAIELGVSIGNAGYFRNWVHSITDKDVYSSHGQFRTVGWQFELGFSLSRNALPVDVFYHHHSQHTLDVTSSFGFPVQDAVGIRIYLVPPKARKAVLP